MRVINLFLVGCVVALSFVIYQQKYESQAMDRRVAELRRAVDGERNAVAVLWAEWSHLNRPKRLERLARKYLGLRPLKASQILTASQYAALAQPSPAQVAARMLGQVDQPMQRRQAALRSGTKH